MVDRLRFPSQHVHSLLFQNRKGRLFSMEKKRKKSEGTNVHQQEKGMPLTLAYGKQCK